MANIDTQAIVWVEGAAAAGADAADVFQRVADLLSDFGVDVDANGFDASARLVSGRYAFRIDHPQKRPLVVLVTMEWDYSGDGDGWRDCSAVTRIEVSRG